jgi:hypothetical protein
VDGCEASPRFGVKNRYKPGEQRTLVLRLREVDALTSFPWKTLWSHSPQAIVFVCFGGVNTKKAGADNDQTVNGRRRLFYIVNPTSLSTSSHSTAYYVRHRHQPWNILVKTPGVAIKAKMGRTKLKRAARGLQEPTHQTGLYLQKRPTSQSDSGILVSREGLVSGSLSTMTGKMGGHRSTLGGAACSLST